jgi:hypothetical protein
MIAHGLQGGEGCALHFQGLDGGLEHVQVQLQPGATVFRSLIFLLMSSPTVGVAMAARHAPHLLHEFDGIG